MRTGIGFEGTWTGRERAGLGKAPIKCDNGMWNGREAGRIWPDCIWEL